MPFLGDIQVGRRPGSTGEWTLLADLVYIGNRDQFLVPKGFTTDFASIPRAFHTLIPKNGRHDAAAIVHDYLYQVSPRVPAKPPLRSMVRVSRKDADGVFLRIMKELGVNPVRRWLMYRAVRLFGGGPWARSREREA